jgi:hypothetical protein
MSSSSSMETTTTTSKLTGPLSLSAIIYFDETLFTDGRTITEFNKINVYNQADRYLATRLNLNISENATNDPNTLNINPPLPGSGVNIYTMDITNKTPQRLEPYNQILIHNDHSDGVVKTPIFIGEHIEGNVYDINKELTDLESAIMLKYFAIHHNVFITRHLYNFVMMKFVDYRKWFKEDFGHLIIQTFNGQLWQNEQVINVPNLQISSDAVDLP